MSVDQSSILEEQQNITNLVSLSRKEANQLIPSVESAYYGLILKGYYLPKITSSIISSDYLLKVLFDKYFGLKSESISIGILLKSVKKYEILMELTSIQLDNNQEWGIDSKHTPDKTWALNVLKTLKPNHHYFSKHDSIVSEIQNFTPEEFNKIKQLDTSVGKKSNAKRFFQIPRELQQSVQEEKNQQKQKALQRKLARKNMLLKEHEKEINQLTQKLEQIQN